MNGYVIESYSKGVRRFFVYLLTYVISKPLRPIIIDYKVHHSSTIVQSVLKQSKGEEEKIDGNENKNEKATRTKKVTKLVRKEITHTRTTPPSQ